MTVPESAVLEPTPGRSLFEPLCRRIVAMFRATVRCVSYQTCLKLITYCVEATSFYTQPRRSTCRERSLRVSLQKANLQNPSMSSFASFRNDVQTLNLELTEVWRDSRKSCSTSSGTAAGRGSCHSTAQYIA